MSEMAENLDDGATSRHRPIVVTLPDGKHREFSEPVTGAELAGAIGPGLAKAAIAHQRRRPAARPCHRD